MALRGAGWFAVLAVVASVAACDVGSSIVADNQTAGDMLARIRGITFPRKLVAGNRPFSYVVIVPARTRLVIAEQPFAGDDVNGVEILAADCRQLAEFTQLELGEVFLIRDGPSVEQLDEFPQGDPTAERTAACGE